MRLWITMLSLLVLARAAHAAPDDIRPWGGPLPGALADEWAAVQVFDAVTGKPVADAEVRIYEEDGAVGFLGAPLLGRTTTDEFGLAAFQWKETPRDAHWIFDAAGYAVLEEYGSSPPEYVWLLPAGEIKARLLDPFGRPAAGVHVELLLGCGHSPAVRIARTTADGAFHFRGVRPGWGRLWFRMPGVYSEYSDVPKNGGTIVTVPGRTVTGIVTDPKGKPVAGVTVASTQTQRGPAVRTGADGRFRLDGVDPSEGIWLFHDSYAGMARPFVYLEEDEIPHAPGRAVDLKLVLPPADLDSEDYFGFLAPGAVAVPITVTEEGTGENLPDVPFHLVSARTGVGQVDEEEEDEEGDETGRRVVMVPPGRYHVTPGEPFDAYRVISPVGPVVVPEEGATAIAAIAVRNPVLRVVGVPGDAKYLDFVLVVDGASTFFRPGPDEDPIHLPSEGVALVRVRDPETGRIAQFLAGPTEDGVRTATVAWKAADPAPTEPKVESRPGVGPIRFVAADGQPIAGRAYRIDRRNRAQWGKTTEEGQPGGGGGTSARSSGGEFVSLPEKLVGPPFRLHLDGYVSRMLAPGKSGELTIRYPAGAIEFTVLGEAGEVKHFAWAVDGMTGRARDGKLTLLGVEPGRRKVLVGAPGHGSVLCVIDVPAEGAKQLTVHLRR